MRKPVGLLAVLLFLLPACGPRDAINISQAPAFDLASKNFTPTRAIVIKNNDLALASKLDIIRNARKELTLMYYIFNPDQSTAYLTQELIRKVEADEDFRIRILVDYHWNYKNLDFFHWLENRQPHGIQQIEVRFYNRPTVKVIKFAEFMTIGCQDGILADSLSTKPACSKEKLAYLAKFDRMSLAEAEAAMSSAAKVFLAGLYAKDPDVLLYAFQQGYARTIDQVTANSGLEKPETIQKEQLINLAQLYWKSKLGSGSERLGAKLRLTVAGILFGDKLNPVIDAIETLLPFTLKDADHGTLLKHPDLDYLTDYIHHKFMLGDTEVLQIGGRNLENSYHMRPNSLTEKYTFMDTDVYFQLNSADGQNIRQTFEDLWNFSSMVATTAEIARHAPIGYVYMVRQATREASESCSGEKDILQQQRCAADLVAKYLEKGMQAFVDTKQGEREAAFNKAREAYHRDYLVKVLPGKSWTDHRQLFDSHHDYVQAAAADTALHAFPYLDVAEGKFFYVENLPFSQLPGTSADRRTRAHGSRYGREVDHGKVIHKVWIDAINQACRDSRKSPEPVEVIIHQGYFSPPAGLIQLMDYILEAGDLCPNVRLKIYTNSRQSTDLAPVSMLGRRQLFALSQVNNLSGPNFEYFEYDKAVLDRIVAEDYQDGRQQEFTESPPGNRASFSLHSKVMIFGDDIYIGSSNADIRSLIMDTNNGVLIRDAPELVKRYKTFLAELEAKEIVRPAKSTFDFPDEEALKMQERADIEELIARYGLERHLESEERQKTFEEIRLQIEWVLKLSYDLTYEMVRSNTLRQRAPFDSYFKMI